MARVGGKFDWSCRSHPVSVLAAPHYRRRRLRAAQGPRSRHPSNLPTTMARPRFRFRLRGGTIRGFKHVPSRTRRQRMQEVFSILVALTALIFGLLGIGWAFGDYRKR